MSDEAVWAEFMQFIQTASEPQAKQWLADNLGRFSPKTRDEVLLAFYEEAKKKQERPAPTSPGMRAFIEGLNEGRGNTRSKTPAPERKQTYGEILRTPKPAPQNLTEALANLLGAFEQLTPEERKKITDAPITKSGVSIAKQLIEKKLGVKFPEEKKPTHDMELGEIE